MNCRKCKKEIPDGSKYCNSCGTIQSPPPRAPKNRGNGQGSVYRKNGKWAASITKYRNGQRATKTKCGFDKKSDALEWLSEARKGRARSATTLSSLYTDWSTSAALKLSTSKQCAYKIAWARLNDISFDPVAELTIGDLQRVLDGLTYYPARDVKTLLSHLYKRACAQGDAAANLAQYIVLPDCESEETEAYTQDELAKMWGAYDKGEAYAGYMLLMIYTGMMPGELLACKIDSIDFSAQTITGAGLKTKERKSKPIVFPSFIAPVLRELIGDRLSGKLIRANRDAFYEQYHAAEARIGIRDLKPYSCRHTTATALAIGDAAAPGIIARVMRQTRPLTTQKYTHADVKAVLKVVNGMKKNPVTALPKGRGKKPNTGM